jgi:hypothetical protein
MSLARRWMFSVECLSVPHAAGAVLARLHLANAGKMGYRFQRQNLVDRCCVSSCDDAVDGSYGAGRTFGATLRVQF